MTTPEQPHADHAPEDRGHPLVSIRTMEVVTSLIMLVLAGVVIAESVRLGFGWAESQGPEPGFFPFIVAVMLAIACAANIARVAFDGADDDETVFVTRQGFGRVLSVLAPLALYVLGVQYLGLYVASAIFIAGFMILIGKEPIWKSAAVSLVVSLVLFFTFERWFLVPLPKGPLEAWLGY